MKYSNPIIQADYSDPDVIRVGEDFYMVASSFNHTPGVPILHSINLVDWEIINYVYEEIPFARFNKVCHGDGAWAPAIRYYNDTYYCIIPFPDEGIYISSTKDPYGKWSDLWCLIEGKGIIDPCPIWTNDKCYLAVGFAKSRIGFNSCIGLYEVSCDLKQQLSDYKIIYDGHNDNPTIEGPKFNERNGYYYIMAPAGSVKGGWQVALRSRNVYGPYETKIVLMQNGTKINGPHQGALIDIDGNDNWAFIHFQDMWAYGRIVHLQPVKWVNDWPICGDTNDYLLAGSPVLSHEYIINKRSDFSIPLCDNFKEKSLGLIWQTPANKKKDFYRLDNGLILNCIKTDDLPLHLVPQALMQKVSCLEFDVESLVDLSNLTDGDEFGFMMMGQEYSYLAVNKKGEKLYIELREGSFNHNTDNVIFSEEYSSNEIKFNLKCTNSNIYDLDYVLGVNDKYFDKKYKASAGRWIGSKIGIYAKGNGGFAKVYYYNVVKKL